VQGLVAAFASLARKVEHDDMVWLLQPIACVEQEVGCTGSHKVGAQA
jgi:hypothetical protein